MKDEELNSAEHAAVVKLADAQGEQKAAEILGVSVGSLLRVLAQRSNVRQGTVALLQRNLSRLGLVKKGVSNA